MKSKTLITLVILFIVGCREDKLEMRLLPGGGEVPQIVANYPENGQRGVNDGESFWVLFNMPMDEQKTQSAFSLSSASGSVAGGFRWEGTKLIFTPAQTPSGGLEHTLTIGRDAESESGVDLGDDCIIRFYPSGDTEQPRFVSSTPANGDSGVDPNAIIILRFSEPIDFSTVDDGITVTPAMISTRTANANRTEIQIVPASPLENGSYTVNVNGAIQDDAGNYLHQEITFSFVVGSDFISPALLSAEAGAIALVEGILTGYVERTDDLVVRFSEPMNQIEAADAVTLSPSVATVKSWNPSGDVLTVHFPDPLDSETDYTLHVDATARDVAGNGLDHNYSFPFITDGPNSLRPQVIQVSQATVDFPDFLGVDGAAVNGLSPPLSNFSVLDVDQKVDINPDPGGLFVLQLQIDFDHEMVENSLWGATSFNHIMGGSISTVSIQDISVSGNGMILRLSGNPATGALYSLRISGDDDGARDLNGNTLLEDYVLYLYF